MTNWIRALTFNVKMLPGPLGRGAADLERARKIVERLWKAEPDFANLAPI